MLSFLLALVTIESVFYIFSLICRVLVFCVSSLCIEFWVSRVCVSSLGLSSMWLVYRVCVFVYLICALYIVHRFLTHHCCRFCALWRLSIQVPLLVIDLLSSFYGCRVLCPTFSLSIYLSIGFIDSCYFFSLSILIYVLCAVRLSTFVGRPAPRLGGSFLSLVLLLRCRNFVRFLYLAYF